MSGTSADGVDVALIRSDGETVFEFIHATTVPYGEGLRADLIHAATNNVPLEDVLQLEQRLTLVHAEACNALLTEANVENQEVGVLGFHGHTIRHDASKQITWQIGDGALLAARTGIPVVHDFRRADIAAGGQGAPLAPLFHQMLFAEQIAARGEIVILNLGGVANVTCPGPGDLIRASDTGPGCGLLDAWVKKHHGQPFDENGRLAAQGTVCESVVAEALTDPFFSQALPRSADRHQFAFPAIEPLSPADGAATLCAITVAAIEKCVGEMNRVPKAVYVCGGGAKNRVIMSMLGRSFENVHPAEAVGLRSDSLEAECFAWLAVRRLRELPTSIPETTGCRRPTVGGSVTLPAKS
jgi:anhydro-N-acetylmuramic acid kinase